MSKIEASVQHGNNTPVDESRFKNIKVLSDHLSKPFYVLFDDSKVKFSLIHKHFDRLISSTDIINRQIYYVYSTNQNLVGS